MTRHEDGRAYRNQRTVRGSANHQVRHPGNVGRRRGLELGAPLLVGQALPVLGDLLEIRCDQPRVGRGPVHVSTVTTIRRGWPVPT